MEFKKFLLFIFCFVKLSLASDPITLDSLFKKQIGLRTITSIEYLSSGNSDFYNSTPYVSVFNDGRNYVDNKQFSLRQSLVYSFNQNIDFILGAKFSYIRSDKEQNNFLAPSTYISEQRTNFDSLSLAFMYSFKSIGSFIPQFYLSFNSYEQIRFDGRTRKFFAKSAHSQLSFKTYSDPLILSLYFGFAYSRNLRFQRADVNFGNAYYTGFNGSIILSPKVSLDISFSQTYQKPSTFNGRAYTSTYSIPTLSLGFSYSLNENTALSLSGTTSGSNQAPSSIFSLSLWKRF